MAEQLDAYFSDNSSTFELPLYQQGTDFQRRVWQALKAIPCGETRSYKQLAGQLQSHPRAIGGACRANPFPIVVPCHRVVAVNGLGGFAGDTQGKLLQIKKWLLQHEGYTAT
jgi:methylated-DNA-[protein]-cysteine S-methyltransferase